ncbi:flagellar basal body rod protein FlgG, partial [Aliarcobacter butzleri]
NGNGYPLQPEIVVPNNVKDISVETDGLVTAKDPQTGDTIELGQITLAVFINPAGLTPLGDSLFMQSDASGDVIEGDPTTEQFG